VIQRCYETLMNRWGTWKNCEEKGRLCHVIFLCIKFSRCLTWRNEKNALKCKTRKIEIYFEFDLNKCCCKLETYCIYTKPNVMLSLMANETIMSFGTGHYLEGWGRGAEEWCKWREARPSLCEAHFLLTLSPHPFCFVQSFGNYAQIYVPPFFPRIKIIDRPPIRTSPPPQSNDGSLTT